MSDFTHQHILVAGLGGRGRAACLALRRRGARVVAVDDADTPRLRENTAPLRVEGIEVKLGVSTVPDRPFDLAVVTPGFAPGSPLFRAIVARGIPVISELELGWRLVNCLTVAITGTNGKSTTTRLLEAILHAEGRRTLAAGHRERPLCGVAETSRELDFLLVPAKAQQLEFTDYFRPAVAVLLNADADHLDRYASRAEHLRALSRVFRRQQPFDWAIIQHEARAELAALDIPIPSKVVTFSATNPEADLYLDRGLILSRVPNWEGPLLDTAQCALRGAGNAENLMAALAAGRALRVPLERMVEAVREVPPAPHCLELVGEHNGVQFVNDSKATNPAALAHALRSLPPGTGGRPNLWLLAGGRGKGLAYHDVGPLLTQRVKGVFTFGEEAENLRAAWGLFVPCTPVASLLEAVNEAVRHASAGDVILLSPACSSFDQFRDYQQRGEVFCQAVKSICGGAPGANSNGQGGTATKTE
ncbi:MAG: UDP-N-acetylmuramoyl-L-alanine--D-glutamate ligase [Limisphaerales bacterium]